MSSATSARTRPGLSPLHGPRAFAGRLKVYAVAASAAGFGVFWVLVSGNVVGATNTPTTTAAQQGSSGQVTNPSSNFFGQTQPQPQFLGNGGFGNGAGNAPVFRSRSS